MISMLLIIVAFDDGQGILSFLLFGLQLKNLNSIHRKLTGLFPTCRDGERVVPVCTTNVCTTNVCMTDRPLPYLQKR